MKFKGIAIPQPWPGVMIEGPKQVVPDQSLSLREILARFTRNEALPIGSTTHYGSDGAIDPESDSEFNIDVEKARYWDLTEKDDFKAMVYAERQKHENIEKAKAEKVKAANAAKSKADFEAAVQKEAAKMAGKQTTAGGSI